MHHYVLDADNHVIVVDLITWAQWFEIDSNRIVAYTQINSEVEVSTIFLGTDHRLFGKGPPLLFETMVFGGRLDEYQHRYSSWDDAKAGHDAIVKQLRKNIFGDPTTDGPGTSHTDVC